MIYLVTDLGTLTEEERLSRLIRLMEEGIDYIVVREKSKAPRSEAVRQEDEARRERLAMALMQYKRKHHRVKTKIIVHSDFNLAKRIGADGVHFTMKDWLAYKTGWLEEQKAVEDVRNNKEDLAKHKLLESKRLNPNDLGEIGVSVHTKEELMQLGAPVSYAFVSPIFCPSCKAVEGKGIKWCQTLNLVAPVPIVALGGITKENVHLIYEHGIAHVAVMSYLMKQDKRLNDLKKKPIRH